jgi:hypothetical protein
MPHWLHRGFVDAASGNTGGPRGQTATAWASRRHNPQDPHHPTVVDIRTCAVIGLDCQVRLAVTSDFVDTFLTCPADGRGGSKVVGRADLGPLSTNRFGRLTGQTVLPVSERHVMKWNGDPYLLDGGSDGRYRDDGAAILLPYWMGRYHRLID